MRKVCHQEEWNGYDEFLTNNFDITAEEVAFFTQEEIYGLVEDNFNLPKLVG
ncbi:hypothetical protein C900_02712 [Fulvivirga imtechensis AK7]|uniref:Uncharacterized protein n=1 Tax=Fulvivirga imtechensis AK7 TaxID=1237149 RepID=L8K2E8_9BACT|nr:hypothetical protein C900_02712 [Fulvivirga imtechensis AK7]